MICTHTNGYYLYIYSYDKNKFVTNAKISLLDYEVAEKAQCLDLTRDTICFR